METKAALGVAGGIALTVAGGVTALLLTFGGPGASPAQAAPVESDTVATSVITEYVDQNGNPVTAPIAEAAAPEVVLINADGTMIESATAHTPAGEPAGHVDDEGHEYEEEDHEEEDHEYGEEDHEEEDHEYGEEDHEEEDHEYGEEDHEEDEHEEDDDYEEEYEDD